MQCFSGVWHSIMNYDVLIAAMGPMVADNDTVLQGYTGQEPNNQSPNRDDNNYSTMTDTEKKGTKEIQERRFQ